MISAVSHVHEIKKKYFDFYSGLYGYDINGGLYIRNEKRDFFSLRI
jgi:hypothetical protein